jgi:hypothetical protein
VLHVGQQVGPGGIPDDLAEDVTEQPDILTHRLGQRGPVVIPISVHGQSVRYIVKHLVASPLA